MAACPNCGRQTLRTKDWACQWCGYPLISRAFKVIDKTFKELQEERSRAALTVDSDMDDEPPETHHDFVEILPPEKEPEPEPKHKQKPEKKPGLFSFRRTQPAPKTASEAKRESVRETPPSRPASRPAPVELPPVQQPVTPPPAPPQPVYTPEPKPEPPPPPKPEDQSAPEPPPAPNAEAAPQCLPTAVPKAELAPPQINTEPIITPPPVTAASPPSPPSPAPAAAKPEPAYTKPEIIVEAPPPHISSVKLDDIKEGMEISADDLDALFRADKSGVNLKLTGKTIVLKGIVEKVFIRDHLDIRYIVVTGKKKLAWSSRCTFNQVDGSKASRLNEGEDVVVRSKYDGYGKNVIFKDCQVI